MNPLIVEAVFSATTFLVLWSVLGNVLFKPYIKLLDEREARTSGDEDVAIAKRQEAKSLQAEIEEQLRIARLEGIRTRDERVSAAKREAQVVIDRAAEQAAQELKRAEQSIAELKSKALAELPAEAEKLSKLVVSRALSTNTSNTIH